MSLLTVHVLTPGIDESVSDAPEALHGEGEAGEGDVLIEHPGVLSGAHHEPILCVTLALLGQPGQGARGQTRGEEHLGRAALPPARYDDGSHKKLIK